jgi:hypothetical protein
MTTSPMQIMGFCTNCGKPLAPGVRFCNNCGAPVPGPASAPSSAQLSTSSAAMGGPKAFRVRVRSRSYSKLDGGWQDIQVASVEDWTQAKQSLLNGFRQRFGTSRLSRSRFGMAPGTQYQRWNDATWSAVSRDLVVDGEDDVLRAFGK